MIPEDYNIYKLSRKELRDYFIVAGGSLALCGYLYYASWQAALLFALTSLLGVKKYKQILAAKRKRELRNQFKDMLYSISSSISSGRHFGEAVSDSEKTVALIHGSKSILAKEIINMKRIMKEANCSEESVMKDLAERSHVKEIIDFTDSCVLCRSMGGNLNKMILKAVYVLTQNIELEREKEVLLSEKRVESRILTCMPIIVIALINLISGDYLESMYTTLFGRFIMTISFALTLTAFLWSAKLMEK